MKKGILIKGKIPPKKHRYLIQFKVQEFKRSAIYLPLLGEEPQKSLSRKTIRKHIKITRRISFTSLCKVYPTYCPKINIGQSPNLLLFPGRWHKGKPRLPWFKKSSNCAQLLNAPPYIGAHEQAHCLFTRNSFSCSLALPGLIRPFITNLHKD